MDENTQVLIKQYVKNKQFLVIESTTAGRSAIEKMLKKTAVSRRNMHFTKNVASSLELMEEFKPNYIICNDILEDGTWKEILEMHLKQRPNRLNSGFLLLSENDSLDAVTKLAQSEIDSLIILPFTVTSLQAELIKVIIPKSAPTEYQILLESAKEFLLYDTDKAFDFIHKAIKKDKKPYEAYHLEGLIHLRSKSLELAKASFDKSIKIAPDYYNSLKELFNIYMLQKDRLRAYHISAHMTEKFPVNPEMIPDLSWVSVACAKYDDILKYHTAFKSIDEPDSQLKNYVAASLAIYGKKIIKDKFEEKKEIGQDLLTRAFKLMEEASMICEDKPLIYASLIKTLNISENKELMENVLQRAQNKFPNNKNIKVLEILINDGKLRPAESLKAAHDAIQNDLETPEIYEIILKRSIEIALSEKIIQENLENAVKAFPDLKTVFEKIVHSTVKAS